MNEALNDNKLLFNFFYIIVINVVCRLKNKKRS